jgi:putative heme-binding domain-containing protein
VRLAAILYIAALSPAQDVNPEAKAAGEAETGRWTFRIFCAPCHGIHADGGRGPNLTLGTYTAGDRDEDLARVISRGVAGTEMAAYAGRVSDEEIRHVVAYIRSVAHNADKAAIRGDSTNGEIVFWSKGGCGQCHRIGTKGNTIGPDLTRVGRQRSVAYLRASLLTPDADVTSGYATVTVVTRDGKKIVGVERNFDNFSAQFVDLSGKYYSFEREDVISMTREPRSLMPFTYGQLLSETEVNDLLAYLSSLRGGK